MSSKKLIKYIISIRTNFMNQNIGNLSNIRFISISSLIVMLKSDF